MKHSEIKLHTLHSDSGQTALTAFQAVKNGGKAVKIGKKKS